MMKTQFHGVPNYAIIKDINSTNVICLKCMRWNYEAPLQHQVTGSHWSKVTRFITWFDFPQPVSKI